MNNLVLVYQQFPRLYYLDYFFIAFLLFMSAFGIVISHTKSVILNPIRENMSFENTFLKNCNLKTYKNVMLHITPGHSFILPIFKIIIDFVGFM